MHTSFREGFEKRAFVSGFGAQNIKRMPSFGAMLKGTAQDIKTGIVNKFKKTFSPTPAKSKPVLRMNMANPKVKPNLLSGEEEHYREQMLGKAPQPKPAGMSSDEFDAALKKHEEDTGIRSKPAEAQPAPQAQPAPEAKPTPTAARGRTRRKGQEAIPEKPPEAPKQEGFFQRYGKPLLYGAGGGATLGFGTGYLMAPDKPPEQGGYFYHYPHQ